MTYDNEPVFEALEDRVLLSGSPIESGTVIYAPADLNLDSAANVVTEILIIDTSVDNYEELLSTFNQNSLDIHFINSVQDGVSEITSILSSYKNLDAVHILSHGSEASVSLGSSTLDADSLSAHSDDISSWSKSLSSSADILFYGCDLASGAEGQAFVSSLATLTGADVAASDDITGVGGDAILEFESGVIETEAILKQGALVSANIGLNTASSELVLDGVDGVVTVPSSSDYDKVEGQGYTVELWFKTTSTSGGTLIDRMTAGDSNGFRLHLEADGQIGYRTATTSNKANIANLGLNLNDGQWHHVALVMNSVDTGTSNTTIFIDGVAVDVYSHAYHYYGFTNTEALEIGHGSQTGHFEGSISNVRLWQDARTEVELNAEMNNDVPTDGTDLVANFILNETSDLTAVDSVSVNNGTLSGGAVWTAPNITNVPAIINVDHDSSSDFDLSDVVFADAQDDSLTVTLTAGAGTFTAVDTANVSVTGSGTGTLRLSASIADIHAYLDNVAAVQYTGSEATSVEVKANDGLVDSSLAAINVGIRESITLNGTNNSLTIVDHADMDFNYNNVSKSMAITTSVKIAADEQGYLFSRETGTGNQAGYYGLINSAGKLEVQFKGWGGAPNLTSTAVIDDGNWHHISVVLNAQNLSIYIDGVLDSSMNHSDYDDGVNITSDLTIGADEDGGTASNFLAASLSDFRIYMSTGNSSISAEDIAAISNGEMPTITNVDMVAQYTFANNTLTNSGTNVNFATATLNGDPLEGVNTAPTITATPETINVDHDSSSDFDLSDVVFADAQDDSLTVTLTAGAGTFAAVDAANVTVTGSASSTLTLSGSIADIHTFLDNIAAIQYTGSETTEVEVKANDGLVDSSLAIISVVVADVNDGDSLLSSGGSASADEGTDVSDLLVVTDVDGITNVAFVMKEQPVVGSATIDSDGRWVFKAPSADWAGEATFTVEVTDDEGFKTSITITATVNPVNDGDSVVTGDTDSSVVDEGSDPSNTLAVTDADGVTNLDFALTPGQPALVHGTAAIDAAGNWTYTPNDPDWSGTESFTVDITDDQGFVTTVTITAIVNPVNDSAIVISGEHDLAVDHGNVTVSGELTNTDVDNNDNVFQAKTETGAYGTLVFNADGTYSYTADASFTSLDRETLYVDSFTVLTEDGTETTITINLERPAFSVQNIIDSRMDPTPNDFVLQTENDLTQALYERLAEVDRSQQFKSQGLSLGSSVFDLSELSPGDVLASIEKAFANRPIESTEVADNGEGIEFVEDFYGKAKDSLTPTQIQFIESILQAAEEVNTGEEEEEEEAENLTLSKFDFITEIEGQAVAEVIPDGVTMYELDHRKSLQDTLNGDFSIFS